MSTLFEDLKKTRATLEKSCWAADTSAGGYTPEHPSTGQCAVTALLVQDLHGGKIVRTTTPEGSHYFNVINGQEADLTRDQFTVWFPTGPTEERMREYLLSSAETVQRYKILTRRFYA